jgi:hypothetical protein
MIHTDTNTCNWRQTYIEQAVFGQALSDLKTTQPVAPQRGIQSTGGDPLDQVFGFRSELTSAKELWYNSQ